MRKHQLPRADYASLISYTAPGLLSRTRVPFQANIEHHGGERFVRRGYRNATIAITALGLFILVVSPLLLDRLERAMISTGPNGPDTPATVGIAYQRLKIPSGSRLLDAYLVEASPSCRPQVALLIFHGVGETISQWVNVQRLLHDHCISSVVFDYSGNGDSSPPGTVRNLHQDAIAAYQLFHARFAATSRICTLGFSMGNAVLLDAYIEFHPVPACMIVGGAFSSARDGAVHSWGIPGWMAHALPDQWNNVAAISHSHSPLLVVHSDADRANPIWMGERIYQAAPQPKQFVILHGLRHNAAYSGPIEQWWAPVIAFTRRTELPVSCFLLPSKQIRLAKEASPRFTGNPGSNPGEEKMGYAGSRLVAAVIRLHSRPRWDSRRIVRQRTGP